MNSRNCAGGSRGSSGFWRRLRTGLARALIWTGALVAIGAEIAAMKIAPWLAATDDQPERTPDA